MKWEEIPINVDAISFDKYGGFIILFVNEDANDGNGSMEIGYIDCDSVVSIYEECEHDVEEFFNRLPYEGAWYHCDNGSEDFQYFVDSWFDADYHIKERQKEMDLLANLSMQK